MALIGASGLLGRRALDQWRQRGFAARLLCRSDAAVADAQPGSSEVVMGDLFDTGALQRLVEGCDMVVNLATAPKAVDGAVDWGANNRVRREGTRLLLQACRHSDAPRLIQQSVAFVEEGDRLNDGTGPLADLPHLASARDMEAAVEQSGNEALILRGGLLWGPGTALQAWARRQKWPADRLRDWSEWLLMVRVSCVGLRRKPPPCAQSPSAQAYLPRDLKSRQGSWAFALGVLATCLPRRADL